MNQKKGGGRNHNKSQCSVEATRRDLVMQTSHDDGKRQKKSTVIGEWSGWKPQSITQTGNPMTNEGNRSPTGLPRHGNAPPNMGGGTGKKNRKLKRRLEKIWMAGNVTRERRGITQQEIQPHGFLKQTRKGIAPTDA